MAFLCCLRQWVRERKRMTDHMVCHGLCDSHSISHFSVLSESEVRSRQRRCSSFTNQQEIRRLSRSVKISAPPFSCSAVCAGLSLTFTTFVENWKCLPGFQTISNQQKPGTHEYVLKYALREYLFHKQNYKLACKIMHLGKKKFLIASCSLLKIEWLFYCKTWFCGNFARLFWGFFRSQIFTSESRNEETEVCFVDIAYDEIPERHYKDSEVGRSSLLIWIGHLLFSTVQYSAVQHTKK